MIRRKLGQDGPEISALALGTMAFTGFYAPATEEESFEVLDAAVELGIDHLDTSNIYGMGLAEEITGRWMADRGRDHFRIATKAGISSDGAGNRRIDNSAAHLVSELDGSLKRLGVERVDLFYVHRREMDRDIEEVVEALVRLKEAGKIGAYGLSEIAPATLRRAAAVHPVAAVQSEYSLQTRQPDLGVIQGCEETGAAFVAFSPVGRGLLSDAPPDAARVERSGFLKANPRFTGERLGRNVAASDALRTLAAEAGMATASLAIGWVLARSQNAVALPGTKSTQHLRELAAGAAEPLPSDLLAQVDRLFPNGGWCEGARYGPGQTTGVEDYC